MFDTHAHIEMMEGPLDGILQRARTAGVGRVLAVGSRAEANRFAVEAALSHAGTVYAAAGFDRDQARAGLTPEEIESMMGGLRRLAAGYPQTIRAIGETGLDYYYHPETAVEQKALFEAQLVLACELDLPVIVHSRDADGDTLSVLAEYSGRRSGGKSCSGVIHCFTRSAEFAEKAVAMGYMISFSGILTFKNAGALRDVAAVLPAEMIVVETDSPFLAPEPVRGNRNEPAFLGHTLECLAGVRGVSVAEMERITDGNAERLLGLRAC